MEVIFLVLKILIFWNFLRLKNQYWKYFNEFSAALICNVALLTTIIDRMKIAAHFYRLTIGKY